MNYYNPRRVDRINNKNTIKIDKSLELEKREWRDIKKNIGKINKEYHILRMK